MSQTHHLIRRNGVWHYRRRVPDTLRAKIGKKEIQVSLKTSNLVDAKKLRAVEDLKWAAQFDHAANCTASTAMGSTGEPLNASLLTEAEVVQRVRALVEAQSVRATRTLSYDSLTPDERVDVAMDVEVTASALKNPSDPRMHQLIDEARGMIGASEAKRGDSLDDFIVEIVRRGLIELQRRKLNILHEDRSRSFFDHLFDPQREPEISFRQLADQSLAILQEDAALNGTSQKWVDKQRAILAQLVEIVGAQTPVRQIDYDVCLAVRGTLARLPIGRTRAYAKLPLEEAIGFARGENAATLAPVTQEQYLATFRNVLSLAAKKRLIGANPAEDLRPLKRDAVANSQKRLPFTPQQLKDIFEGAYYRSAARHSPPYAADKNGWRFWLPLLCLFMGLRPNEACQMRPGDVKCTNAGTWFVDVTASVDEEEVEGAQKTLKTVASRRSIPIHPELFAIGFVEFAQRRLRASAILLFDGIKPDAYGNHAKYALKRFREQYLPQATTLGERQSFYSFRHNFRDALRRSEAPPDALRALGGWSQGKLVSDDYGDVSDPDYQLRYMQRLAFPTLDLSFLHNLGSAINCSH